METITETELLDMDVETLLHARAQPSMSASYPSPLTSDCADPDTLLSTEDRENPFKGETQFTDNSQTQNIWFWEELLWRKNGSPSMGKVKLKGWMQRFHLKSNAGGNGGIFVLNTRFHHYHSVSGTFSISCHWTCHNNYSWQNPFQFVV